MVLDWTAEEKTLLNMKKIIASVWRMNRQQLYSYCRRMQKKQPEILPGQIGIVFLKKLKRTADGDMNAASKVWPDLMQDTERMLKLIRAKQNLDQKAWLEALPRLEAQQERCFKTELGVAFVMTLKEKLGICMSEKRREHHAEISSVNTAQTVIMDDKKELEKVAAWLMKDLPGKEKVQKKKIIFFCEWARQAAIPALACLSVCCMAIWLYGQAGRNMDRWNLQQMKVSAVQKADVSMEENFRAIPGTVSRPEKPEDADQLVKKVKIQKKPEVKKHPEKLPQYREMSGKYPQLYGWLQIPDTQIDLPVMRPESDRDFYLHHDFTGAESAEGALFVDAESSLWPQDGNTVIYGHNMKNGHIFGTLKMYGDADFFREHREIHFDTLYETGVYEAAAVLKTRILNEDETGFRYYRFFQYRNEKEFQKCRDFVEDNRLFETDITLQYGDQILMLSTCEYSQENGRLVVVARKQNEKSDDGG